MWQMKGNTLVRGTIYSITMEEVIDGVATGREFTERYNADTSLDDFKTRIDARIAALRVEPAVIGTLIKELIFDV